MSEPIVPSQIHPALTEDRLIIIGDVLREKCTEAAKRFDQSSGETLLTFGVSRFERTRFALIKLAASRKYSWFSIDDSGPHFVVRIGGVPLRIYRGYGEDEFAPDRYARRNPAELRAIQQAFALFDTPTPEHLIRFEIETDSGGFPLEIRLLQVDSEGKKSEHPYVIPKLAWKRVQPRAKSAKVLQLPNVGSLEPDKREGTTSDV